VHSLVDESRARELLGGISKGLLRRLVVSGQLPSVRVGARRLFALSDIEAFVDDRREHGEAPGGPS